MSGERCNKLLNTKRLDVWTHRKRIVIRWKIDSGNAYYSPCHGSRFFFFFQLRVNVQPRRFIFHASCRRCEIPRKKKNCKTQTQVFRKFENTLTRVYLLIYLSWSRDSEIILENLQLWKLQRNRHIKLLSWREIVSKEILIKSLITLKVK